MVVRCPHLASTAPAIRIARREESPAVRPIALEDAARSQHRWTCIPARHVEVPGISKDEWRVGGTTRAPRISSSDQGRLVRATPLATRHSLAMAGQAE